MARPVGEFGDEGVALGQLVACRVFVGLVRNRNVAGTADHGRNAGRLELARFGAERHRLGAVGPRQRQGKLGGRAVDLGLEAGDRGIARHRNACFGRFLFDRSIELGDFGGGLRVDRLRVRPRQGAELPRERAFARHDIGSRSAMNETNAERRPGWVERHAGDGVGEALFAQLGLQRVEERQEPTHIDDGVGPQMRRTRMRLAADDRHAVDPAALVADDDAHHRGFADDAECGLRQVAPEQFDRVGGAETADLFVVGQAQMDRALQLGEHEGGHGRQRAGDEAFHIGRAAPIEPPVALDERKRIARPRLAFDGNDIRMAREHGTARNLRPDRGDEIGLGAVGVGHKAACDTVGLEIAAQLGQKPGIDGAELHENTQTKFITNNIDIDKYNTRLVSPETIQNNWFIGQTESFDLAKDFIDNNVVVTLEDIDKLPDILGIEKFKNMSKVNETRSLSGVTKEQYDKIVSMNELDLEVYQYAKTKKNY